MKNETCAHIVGVVPEIVNNVEGLYEGNLRHYFRKLFFEATNLSNPYHNFRHVFHVFVTCYEAGKFYIKLDPSLLTPRMFRALLIASMNHDTDHTGRSTRDDIQVTLATHAVKKWILEEDRDMLPSVLELIGWTQYPYEAASDTLPLAGRIIRDADLSQALSNVWVQQILFGLGAEMNVTPHTMLKGQEAFLRSLKFSTSWAQQVFGLQVIEAKIGEVRSYLSILDGTD